MKHQFAIPIIVLLLSMALAVDAADTNPEDAATPLGYTLGSATFKEIKNDLEKKTEVRDAGTNRYSQGPMLEANGDRMGIRDLETSLFIFEQDRRLAAVVLTFRKVDMGRNFDRIYGHLASKYALVSKRVPFVGDKAAHFETGSAIIDLEAPHLGFAITVTYKTRELDKRYRSQLDQNRKQEQRDSRKQF